MTSLSLSSLKRHLIQGPLSSPLIAFLIFLASLAIYISTLSPSVSFWDCGEFILCARYLEVGHPPGAPLYLLLARLFSLFASSPSDVAWCVNLLSAVASAAATSFVFLISLYVIRLAFPSAHRPHAVMASVIASLAFAFCDSIWFSAVEAEVYSLSICLTSLTLFLILRWHFHPDNHLLWLIIYIIGLSSGVHLLNLLVVPVLFLVVGYDMFHGEHSRLLTASLSFLAGILALAFLFFGLISNGLQSASILEMYLSISLGLPVHSGLITFFALMFVFLFVFVFITMRMRYLHPFALFLLLFSIGYSSNALIIIRSCAHPTVNLGQPDNVFDLNSYVNRDMYGSRPILYGPHYASVTSHSSSEVRFSRTSTIYNDHNHSSYSAYSVITPLYDGSQKVILPRILDPWAAHFSGLSNDEAPSLADNLHFLFSYQLSHMFGRYVMWNFSSRQNDIKANYFLLPILLALLGLFALMASSRSSYALTFCLLTFLLTGPAIAFYLNMQPFEPRERDYVFLGAYLSICLFIAAGAYYIIYKVASLSRSRLTTSLVSLLLFMAVPVLMFSQNFRGHDRSSRFVDLELSKAILNACDSDAILITFGDNDTYPLWYLQEVEGYRTDVSVINYGLLATFWYHNQLFHQPRHHGLRPLIDSSLCIPHENYIAYNVSHALLATADSLALVDHNNLDKVNNNDIALLNIIHSNIALRPIFFTNSSVTNLLVDIPSNVIGPVCRIGLPSDTTSALRRISFFLDDCHIPPLSSYTPSYDVINCLAASSFDSQPVVAALDAMALGRDSDALVILKRCADYFPVVENANAPQLISLIHQLGDISYADSLVYCLNDYYPSDSLLSNYPNFAGECRSTLSSPDNDTTSLSNDIDSSPSHAASPLVY